MQCNSRAKRMKRRIERKSGRRVLAIVCMHTKSIEKKKSFKWEFQTANHRVEFIICVHDKHFVHIECVAKSQLDGEIGIFKWKELHVGASEMEWFSVLKSFWNAVTVIVVEKLEASNYKTEKMSQCKHTNAAAAHKVSQLSKKTTHWLAYAKKETETVCQITSVSEPRRNGMNWEKNWKAIIARTLCMCVIRLTINFCPMVVVLILVIAIDSS